MNKLNDVWNFLAAHKAVFAIATCWAAREWTTVGGWVGLLNWLKTGEIKKALAAEQATIVLPPKNLPLPIATPISASPESKP